MLEMTTTTEEEFKAELRECMFKFLMEEQEADSADGISAQDFYKERLERFINDDFSSHTLLCVADADGEHGADFYWEGALPFGGSAYLLRGRAKYDTDEGFLEDVWRLEQQARRAYVTSYKKAKDHFSNL